MPKKGVKVSEEARAKNRESIASWKSANIESLTVPLRKGKKEAYKRLAQARGTSVAGMIQEHLDAEYFLEFGEHVKIKEVVSMKEIKKDIVDAICAAAEGSKIVSLKEAADKKNVKHITRQDTTDILNAVLKRLPNYRAVRMMKTPNDSLFQSLTFIQNDVEFDDYHLKSMKSINKEEKTMLIYAVDIYTKGADGDVVRAEME